MLIKCNAIDANYAYIKNNSPSVLLTHMAQPKYSPLIELFHVPTKLYRRKV